MALSDILNSPYLAADELTTNAILNRGALGSFNNILNTALSAAGVASTLSKGLTDAGLTINTVGNQINLNVDSIVSGGDPYFDISAPERITQSALDNRNFTDDANPETKINDTQVLIYAADVQFPDPPAKHYIRFQFAKYLRKDPLGDTTVENMDAVVLPLPDSIVDPSSVRWQETNLGLLGALYEGGLQDPSKAGIAIGVAAAENAEAIGSEVGAFLGGSLLGKFLGTTGKAVESITNIAKIEQGWIPNPVLAQMFTGLGFRSFGFSWILSAKNEAESNKIKEIVRRFKYHSLPTFSSQGAFFFNYPDIVQPSFSSDIAQHMMPFKYCVIKDVNVNYNGSNTPAFYKKSNQPVAIILSITLEEMEYVNRGDYGENPIDDKKNSNMSVSDIRKRVESFRNKGVPLPGT